MDKNIPLSCIIEDKINPVRVKENHFLIKKIFVLKSFSIGKLFFML